MPPLKYHKKTILQVVPALVSGGVERGTIDIAGKLKNIGHTPIVISAGGPLVEKLERAGVMHIILNVASKNPLVIWRNAKKIADIIRKYKVDIIHARSRAPAWSCYMAAKKTNTKFITTFHGIYNFSGFLKKYYNSIMTEGKIVIAVSEFVKRHIIENYKANPDKIRVIYRGVDHKYFNQANISEEIIAKFKEKYNVPGNVPVILLPSRMTEWKGHMVLVKALEKIKHLNFYCLMVGDLSKHPDFIQRVQTSIKELKLQSKVQIFSNENDMPSLYGISDIVLSTSIEPEAFGRTIIEAQSMEKLVIATNIGGAAETIVDGQTGYHVKANDAGELAQKIEYCLSILNTKTAEKITTAARKSVIKNFSLDSMLDKVLKIYEEV